MICYQIMNIPIILNFSSTEAKLRTNRPREAKAREPYGLYIMLIEFQHSVPCSRTCFTETISIKKSASFKAKVGRSRPVILIHRCTQRNAFSALNNTQRNNFWAKYIRAKYIHIIHALFISYLTISLISVNFQFGRNSLPYFTLIYFLYK